MSDHKPNLHFKFWVKWLQIVCIMFILFGVILAIFSQTLAMDFLLNNQINPVFFNEATFTSEVRQFQLWSYALLGSGCVFAGILMFLLQATHLSRKKNGLGKRSW